MPIGPVSSVASAASAGGSAPNSDDDSVDEQLGVLDLNYNYESDYESCSEYDSDHEVKEASDPPGAPLKKNARVPKFDATRPDIVKQLIVAINNDNGP